MGEYVGRVVDYDDDNDDALSCSYDGSGICNVAELDGHESCDEHDHGDEKKEDDEEKDVNVVYGTSYCEDDDEIQEHHKSFVSFDSGQEFMDEMEKNRLFWEACLAS
ncbi:hypothetical protein SESBI_04660 [Sesbania bispinosa]|nr:hypothetical protein SESBI_04660 [Sesbania bispinosa]